MVFKDKKIDWFSLILLSIAAFIFVSAELLPIGILHEISAGFSKSIGKTGLVVTVYAWTVSFSAIFITTLLSKIERRLLLVSILFIFSFANLLIVLSTSFFMLMIARILSAISHGVFWAIVASLAMQFSGDKPKSHATAIVFAGIAMASVVAVPTGNLIAQSIGWRSPFIFIVAISALLFILVLIRFPVIHIKNKIQLSQLKSLFNDKKSRCILLATAIAIMGHFCAFTYISFLLEKNMGVSPSHLFLYLFLFGIAGVFGNMLAAKLADHHLIISSKYIMITMGVIIFSTGLHFSSHFSACIVFLWGFGICMLTVALQSIILTLPSDLKDIGSAVYVSMFNIGIGTGALLGGLCVDHFSLQSCAFLGGIMLLVSAAII